jgi:hypothetical protein
MGTFAPLQLVVPYACKKCVLDGKRWGENFQQAETFATPRELIAHINLHLGVSVTESSAAYPGILEDAQAVAAGYLVCCHDADCTSIAFTCFRCSATTIHPNDVNERYCVMCGRKYQNFYSPHVADRPSQPDPASSFE